MKLLGSIACVLLLPVVNCGVIWENDFRNAEFKHRSAYQDRDFNNLALYWGQGNNREQPLSYYCQQPGVSIIIVGFVHDFTGGTNNSPIINVADHCEDVESCPQVGKDISFCQEQGVKVLMSLGGASGPYRHQKWEPDTLAWSLWNKFLGGTYPAINRPFGGAIMDGIDFDPEAVSGEGYDKLVHNLRVLSKLYVPTKKFLLTAAPQCPDLDYYKKNAMYNILHPNPQYTEAYLDMVFVQFYNNYCSASEFEKAALDTNSRTFNFGAWNSWAEQASKSTKIYLGILGKQGRHDSGYVQFNQLTKIIDDVHRFSKFGGVMIWDALHAYSNPVFNGEQYGKATSQYLTRLASPPPVVRLDNTMPLLLPLGNNSYSVPSETSKDVTTEVLTPFSCTNGQGFVLLNSVVLQNLLDHVGPHQQLNDLDPMYKEKDLDSVLTKGSYICLGPLTDNDRAVGIGLNYIYNATAATIDDRRLEFSLSFSGE